VLSNPASVFVGGVTAVLFELADPRVRSGVWDHVNLRFHCAEGSGSKRRLADFRSRLLGKR
jgi:uncharacterized protein (DUF2236 family)